MRGGEKEYFFILYVFEIYSGSEMFQMYDLLHGGKIVQVGFFRDEFLARSGGARNTNIPLRKDNQ